MNSNAAGRTVDWSTYLTPTERLLLHYLIKRADFKDLRMSEPYPWPTERQLSHRIGRSVRTVRRLLRHVEHHGFVRVDRGLGRGNRSSYALLPRTPDLQCDCPKRPGKGDTLTAGKGDTEPSIKGDAEGPEKGTPRGLKEDTSVRLKEVTSVRLKGDTKRGHVAGQTAQIPTVKGRAMKGGSSVTVVGSRQTDWSRWPAGSIGEEEHEKARAEQARARGGAG